MNANTCVLYQGDSPHPAHRTFGDAVDATYCHFETANPPGNKNREGSVWSRIHTGMNLSDEYDIIIAEGSAPLQTALVFGAFRNHRTTVLYLAADETFFTLKNRSTRHVWRALRPVVRNAVDGCISVSDMAYSWCRPYLGRQRNEIVHPPIPANRYADLRGLSPKSTNNSFEILSVGRAVPIKNHWSLVKSVLKINNQTETDLFLTLVGEKHTERGYATYERVSTPGYVSNKDLVTLYDQADLYIHPSIADAYPVATLEAMLSATPTVVTDCVGTASRLPPEYVCKPTVNELSSTIRRCVNMTAVTNKRIGRQLRSSVEGLVEASQASKFQKAVSRFK